MYIHILYDIHIIQIQICIHIYIYTGPKMEMETYLPQILDVPSLRSSLLRESPRGVLANHPGPGFRDYRGINDPQNGDQ